MTFWILALLLAAQDKPPATCTLSGIVVNSVTSAPLGKVDVIAEAVNQDSPPSSTVTDAQGRFTMVDLPAGHYRLHGSRNNYLDTNYGARRPNSPGTVIALDPGQELKDLQLKLIPPSGISGTIRDTDGEPMSGAEVALFRQSYTDDGHREIRADAELFTDDQGVYRISGLDPGKYYLKAAPPGRNDYGFMTPVDRSRKPADTPPVLLPTLYPGVIDPQSARTVDLGVGAHLTGVDITLVRSRVFHVTVQAAAGPGMIVLQAALYNAPPEWRFGLQLQTHTRNAAGDFEFHGVPPGAYTLDVRGDSDAVRGRMPLTVSSDLEGVRVAISVPPEVTGQVKIEGDEALAQETARIFFDAGTRSGEAFLHDHNQFDTRLFPAHYQVYVNSQNRKLFVKDIRAQGVDILHKGLTVTDAPPPPIEITLAANGGQVEGVALGADDQPATGATVLLVADPALRARTDSYHSVAVDQYGRYRFENVPPGDYKLFAWTDVEPYIWFDPEFLKDFEAKAESITIDPNGHATVKLHVQ